MKRYAVLAIMAVAVGANAQTLLAQWNFNDENFTVDAVDWAPRATVIEQFGGVAAPAAGQFASGSPLNDPAGTDRALNTSAYPAQGTGNGTAGVRAFVNLSGATGVVVSFDQRHSNTSSRFTRFEYTLDGGTSWVTTGLTDGGVMSGGTSGDQWFSRSFDLTGLSGVDNNANFGFRVVAIFDPALGNAYTATRSSSSYSTAGTLRYDWVTVTSTNAPVPEPASIAALAVGAVALIRRRRAK